MHGIYKIEKSFNHSQIKSKTNRGTNDIDVCVELLYLPCRCAFLFLLYRLNHPAGIAVYEDSLYVVSQDENKILEFSISTGEKKQTLVKDLADTPEQLIINYC